MIHIVSGMIGSGKTTFCLGHDLVIDLDCMDEQSKIAQIDLLVRNIDKEVYYITCYPTALELEVFSEIPYIEHIWINTNLNQCSKNILARASPDDLMFYHEKIEKNNFLQKLYLTSNINFKVIDVFSTDERW